MLTALSPGQAYRKKPLTYEGVEGDVVNLFLSGSPARGFLAGGFTGSAYRHLANPLQSLAIGTAPASGELSLSLGPADISTEGASLYAQAMYVNGAESGLSSPTQLHIRRGLARSIERIPIGPGLTPP